MAQRLIYHWKHGWIPLDHYAALSKAHGRESGAKLLMGRFGITGEDGKSRHLEQHLRDHQPPPGYQVTEGVIHEGTPFAMSTGRYSFVDPSGQHHYVGGSKKVATRRAHDHAQKAASDEAARLQLVAERQAVADQKAAQEKSIRDRVLPQISKAEAAEMARVGQLAVAMRHNRSGPDEPSLDSQRLIAVRDSPHTAEEDKQYASRDLAILGARSVRVRLGGRSDAELAALRSKIRNSNLPEHEKMAALAYIAQRLGGAGKP